MAANQPVTGPESSAGSAATRAWKAHVQTLTPVERRLFDEHKKADFDRYVEAIEQSCKKQGEISRSLKVAQWLEPLFVALNIYLPAAEAAAQAHPNPATIILGGIVCIMNMSKGLVRYQQMMTKTLSRMGRKSVILGEYDKILYQTEPSVQAALELVYIDILTFCRKALRHLVNDKGEEKGALKTFKLSLIRPSDVEFGDIADKFEKDLDDLESRAINCDRKRAQAMAEKQDAIAVRFATFEEHLKSHMTREEHREKREADRAKAKKKSAILKWIPSANPSKYYDERCREHLEGTGKWFTDCQAYSTWKLAPASTIIRVEGKAGSGKSVLAAITISDLEPSAKPGIGLAYVFCKSAEPSARDPLIVICSILKQFYKQVEDVDADMEVLFDTCADLQPDGPSWQQISGALRRLLSKFEEAFIVIDGLDECQEAGEVAIFVRNLVQANESSAVKVIVFSRTDHPEIYLELDEYPSLEVNAETNSGDIQKFIDTSLSDRRFLKRDDPKFRESLQKVQDELRLKAEGMFLYVSLFIKRLDRSLTANQILARIEATPKGLSEVYKLSMGRIYELQDDSRETSFQVLLWTLNSTRPMSEAEMLEAVAIKSGSDNLDEGDLLPDGSLLTALCADLVLLDSDRYFVLVHASFKDFALDLPSSTLRPHEEFQSLQLSANYVIADKCLTYLLFDRFSEARANNIEELREMVQQHPFLKYAGKELGQHITTENEPAVRANLLKLASLSCNRRLALQLCNSHLKYVDPGDNDWNPLHLLSGYGLLETSKSMDNLQEFVDEPDGWGKLPYDFAIASKSRSGDTCCWLLDRMSPRGDKILSEATLKMHVAAGMGLTEVVQKMVEKGFDINQWSETSMVTPLFTAVKFGKEEVAQCLIQNGADLNAADETGCTSLLQALRLGNSTMAMGLIDAGADVNRGLKDGVMPLHYAFDFGCPAVVKPLIEKGADPGAVAEGFDSYTPIHRAARVNEAQAIRLLVKAGASPDCKEAYGSTPLHSASRRGALEAAQCLISLRASPSPVNQIGYTPAHMAAEYGHLATLQYLQTVCADVDPIDVYGRTPLYLAAGNGHLDLVRHLIQKRASVNHADKDNETALTRAINGGHLDIVIELLRNGADPNIRWRFNFTPLHNAAAIGRADMISPLLEYGAQPDTKNEDGFTPLFFGAALGHLGFVKRLIELRPEVDLNAKDNAGRTSLHMAAARGFLDTVSFLLDKGVDIVPDDEGDYPVYWAVCKGHHEICSKLVTEQNVNIPRRNGMTLLHAAASSGSVEVARVLLDANADINALDGSSASPLLAAMTFDNLEVALFLLDRGANHKAVTNTKLSILHGAATAGYHSICEKLLDLGEDPLARDARGYSAFSLALAYYRYEVIDLFLSRGYKDFQSKIFGVLCSHLVAAQNDVPMLMKMIGAGESLNALSERGWTTLHAAAEKGRLSMIYHLLDQGIPLDSVNNDGISPLHLAASSLASVAVGKLIEFGANVNRQQPAAKMTSLGICSAMGGAISASHLIEGGADIYHVDAWGLRPIDYAQRHPEVWASFKKVVSVYEPRDQNTIRLQLLKTICDCCQTLIALTSKKKPGEYAQRLRLEERLEAVVATAILHLDKEDSRGYAARLIKECVDQHLDNSQQESLKCVVCRSVISDGDMAACKTCFQAYMCKACSHMYSGSAESKSDLYKWRNSFTELEEKTGSVRDAIRYDFSMDVVWICGTFLTWKPAVEWLKEQLHLYEITERICAKYPQFEDFCLPGKLFVRLIKGMTLKADKTKLKWEDWTNLLTAPQATFYERALKELELEFPPGCEIPKACSGHDFLPIAKGNRVPTIYTNADVDASGLLKPSFFQDIWKTFKDQNSLSRVTNSIRSSRLHLAIRPGKTSKEVRLHSRREPEITDPESPERRILERKLVVGTTPTRGRDFKKTYQKDLPGPSNVTLVYHTTVYVDANPEISSYLVDINILDAIEPGRAVETWDELLEKGEVKVVEETYADWDLLRDIQKKWKAVLAPPL